MATVEYTALVVVVGLALAVGAALTDARALPGAVGTQVRRAFCLVANGDCTAAGTARPCVVSGRTRDRLTEVHVAMVRLRDGRVVLRERLSDGTVRVTVASSAGASVGTTFGLRFGGRAIDADLAGGGDLESARTFVVGDARAADRLVERLEDAALPVGEGVRGAVDFVLDRGAADGDEVARTAWVRSRGEAATEVLGAELGALAGWAVGVRSGRDGRSVLLSFPRALEADLAGALGGDARWMVEGELLLGTGRRPATLVVRGAGAAAGGRLEGEARVDLDDVRAEEILAALRRGSSTAAGALAGYVRDRARVDLRRYATSDDTTEQGVEVGAFGGAKTVVTTTDRLVAAYGREPGGSWAPNLECLP